MYKLLMKTTSVESEPAAAQMWQSLSQFPHSQLEVKCLVQGPVVEMREGHDSSASGEVKIKL